MLRNAVTRQCSVISPVAAFNSTGETVPQKGQTRACFAGFHCASPPHAGQLNFFCAVTSDIANYGGLYFSGADLSGTAASGSEAGAAGSGATGGKAEDRSAGGAAGAGAT